MIYHDFSVKTSGRLGARSSRIVQTCAVVRARTRHDQSPVVNTAAVQKRKGLQAPEESGQEWRTHPVSSLPRVTELTVPNLRSVWRLGAHYPFTDPPGTTPMYVNMSWIDGLGLETKSNPFMTPGSKVLGFKDLPQHHGADPVPTNGASNARNRRLHVVVMDINCHLCSTFTWDD